MVPRKLRKVSVLLPELQDHRKQAMCFEKDCYTDDEAALLSEILPPLSWSNSSAASTSSPSQRTKAKDSSISDAELMSTMVKRLTDMEQRVRSQAQEISRKNQKIAVLEEKLSLLQLSNADKPKRKQELEKLHQLQNQVWEMEKFLSDYGMIWVGSEKDETSNVYLKEEEEPQELPNPSELPSHPDGRHHDPVTEESSEHQVQQSEVNDSSESGSLPTIPQSRLALPCSEALPHEPSSALEKDVIALQDVQGSVQTSDYHSLEEPVIKGIQKLEHNMNSVIQEVSSDTALKSFQMDFNLVVENIKDLNILAGEGEARVEHTTGGARLKRPDPVPLTLFKNGIVMFNGPFRSYDEPSTQYCMQDIMDGYFPSELQNRYPEGVPIKVTDRRDLIFRDRQLHAEFPGMGQTIGGTYCQTNQERGPKLSVEQFLNKLPKTIIRAGKVIDIRGDIKDILQVPSKPANENTILIETPTLAKLRERLAFSEENDRGLRNISTLRIKSEDGEKMYIVKMLFSETVGALRSYLNQNRGKQQADYDIISTFPQQVYSDQSKTLKEYGLIPNAMLILRARKPQLLDQEKGALSQDEE
ncbi:UBX domain-containing protein 11 [Hemiscyllium ocellatum]|uniref:UBX domain-containing protein 11 n=1 Tax=Hemiscyllium ocellatum TaxID=170820 RepID=UPI002966B17D|nr:UBX domain-containing protein 11 [Hemiscyllium ocellatum]